MREAGAGAPARARRGSWRRPAVAGLVAAGLLAGVSLAGVSPSGGGAAGPASGMQAPPFGAAPIPPAPPAVSAQELPTLQVSYDAVRDRISLGARDARLDELLRAVAAATGLALELPAPGLARRVRLELDPMPLEEALARLLAGLDAAVLHAGAPARPVRVVVAQAAEHEAPPNPYSADPVDALVRAVAAADAASVAALAEVLAAPEQTRLVEETGEALVDLLDSAESADPMLVVQVLAALAPERARRELVLRLAGDPQQEAGADLARRVRAARGLGVVGDERDVEPLLAAFSSGHRELRIAAAESIQRIRDRRRSAASAPCLSAARSTRSGSCATSSRGSPPSTP